MHHQSVESHPSSFLQVPILSILPQSKTEYLLHVHNSGVLPIPPCFGNWGYLLIPTTSPDTDPARWSGRLSASAVLFGTGQMRAVLGGRKWRRHWEVNSELDFSLNLVGGHFWCCKDFKGFERLLNADIYERKHHCSLISLHLRFTLLTLGRHIFPWQGQILWLAITTWRLVKADRLFVVKRAAACGVCKLELQSI